MYEDYCNNVLQHLALMVVDYHADYHWDYDEVGEKGPVWLTTCLRMSISPIITQEFIIRIV